MIYEETRGVLKTFLENTLRDAVTYTEHARRKTVTAMDIVYALKRQGRTLYGYSGESTSVSRKITPGEAAEERAQKVARRRAFAAHVQGQPMPSNAGFISQARVDVAAQRPAVARAARPAATTAHYTPSDLNFRSIMSAAMAESACNAFGIEILEDGDWDAVLDEASGLYVASDPTSGTPLAFLVHIDAAPTGHPASFSRLTWRTGGRRVSSEQAATVLRRGVGAADDANVGEIMLMCRTPTAPGGVVRQLLGVYMQGQLASGDVVYAGATRGETATGRGPTTAWQRLGFTHLTALNVREGRHDQNVCVLRVP